MEQMKDLTVALEESESCCIKTPAIASSSSTSLITSAATIGSDHTRRWSLRRRTRSAGNLSVYAKSGGDNNNSEDSSSTTSEVRINGRGEKIQIYHHRKKRQELHHSDSDDTALTFSIRHLNNVRSHSLRMKHSTSMQHPFHFKTRYTKFDLIESDSFNEASPARPNMRRKRKLKRMSIDETPILACGKRKRPHRYEIIENGRAIRYTTKIKRLNQNVIEKIERFCHPSDFPEVDRMETQYIDCDVNSESSLSWSDDEGHEGDDELTDWAPCQEGAAGAGDPSNPWPAHTIEDPREIRAGCRRLRDDLRPGFTITSSAANERVAKFLQDSSKFELRLFKAIDHEKLAQLASLYSLEMWVEDSGSSAHSNKSAVVLRKTSKTPCMQSQNQNQTRVIFSHSS